MTGPERDYLIPIIESDLECQVTITVTESKKWVLYITAQGSGKSQEYLVTRHINHAPILYRLVDNPFKSR